MKERESDKGRREGRKKETESLVTLKLYIKHHLKPDPPMDFSLM